MLSSLSVSALASPLISRVVVSGGTHGNEYTGVYVVQRLGLQEQALRDAYPTLNIETLVANPLAHKDNRRFVHADLNRMFTVAELADISGFGYEPNRAKAIQAELGPKGPNAAADMIVDLHTTTANMGCTLIVDEWCPLAIHAAAYVASRWNTVRYIYLYLDLLKTRPDLDALQRQHVGPTAHKLCIAT